MHEKDHHDDPSRVIPLLGAELGLLARELIGAGFRVVDAWGPVQMAVAQLLLERDGTRVLFDTERGVADVVLERDGRRTDFGTAVAAWACSPGSDGRPHDADFLPWGLTPASADLRAAQLAAYGVAVCEWFSEADPGVIDFVKAESAAIFVWSRRETTSKPAAAPEMVAARYREALARYFGDSSSDRQ